VEARWQSGTLLRSDAGLGGGVPAARPGDLAFSDISTVNLRLFADLGGRRELARRHPWLRGARVSLAVNNVFDTRLEVRDEAGLTPLSYQGDYLDPLGRSVRLSVRKLFLPRRLAAALREAAAGERDRETGGGRRRP
jgi:outer membrane receptor protein involved in Fe transport